MISRLPPPDAAFRPDRPLIIRSLQLTAHPCALVLVSAPLLFQPAPDAVYGFPNARRIAHVDSPYQHIEVWDTPQLGRLFTLDGRPMTSVGDEFIYHECMTHPAALTHPAPRAALVLGGGDGGAAKQLLAHRCIERIVVAELDAEVVRLTLEHLPQVHGGAFDDLRVELVIGDAAEFVERTRERFDLVVFDLTPPDSPAAGLYAPAFLTRLKHALTPDAAISLHLGSPYFHAARIEALLVDLQQAFAVVRPMAAYVPLYGFAMADGDCERHARRGRDRGTRTDTADRAARLACAALVRRGAARRAVRRSARGAR